MRRAEHDDELEAPERNYGRAESNVDPLDDDGGPFPGWLYVPDLSSTTGWTSVQLRKSSPQPRARSHVGFRRR